MLDLSVSQVMKAAQMMMNTNITKAVSSYMRHGGSRQDNVMQGKRENIWK